MIVAVRCSIAPSSERVKRSTTRSWSLCRARQIVVRRSALRRGRRACLQRPHRWPGEVGVWSADAFGHPCRRCGGRPIPRSAAPCGRRQAAGSRSDAARRSGGPAPRLTLEQSGVVGRIDRKESQGGGRHPALDVGVELVGLGFGTELRDRLAVVGRVVQQCVQPLDAGIRAPGREARDDRHRQVAPHPPPSIEDLGCAVPAAGHASDATSRTSQGASLGRTTVLGSSTGPCSPP